MAIMRQHGTQLQGTALRVQFPIAAVKRQIWVRWLIGKPKPKNIRVITSSNIIIDISPDAARAIVQFNSGVKLPARCAVIDLDDIRYMMSLEMVLIYDRPAQHNFVSVTTVDTVIK